MSSKRNAHQWTPDEASEAGRKGGARRQEQRRELFRLRRLARDDFKKFIEEQEAIRKNTTLPDAERDRLLAIYEAVVEHMLSREQPGVFQARPQGAPSPVTDEETKQIESVVEYFCQIYLGGLPPIITNDSAFLSFVCMVCAFDALSGYRYANTVAGTGNRFRTFVANYFPEPYRSDPERLWKFRCRMLHGFSPAGYVLTHHHSEDHLKLLADGRWYLNAEDFYALLVNIAQTYFAELLVSDELKRLFLARLRDHEQGGPIVVGPVS